MKVELKISHKDSEKEQIKKNKLLMKIYKEFPEAMWEKLQDGFKVLI